ncbi:MAG TPA: NB-ARC domain-containing protein, partial [Phototrophicaceae bacterium]|nr:NB-ARC domain-containing protein [Phototrophicaceae bacterium]
MSDSEHIRVFLSYARADDEDFVRKLYLDLKRLGFDPWYDREHMTADGTPFTQSIADAIRANRHLLFIAGPRSAASDYCKGEWSLALECCIPVLPLLRLDDYKIIPSAISNGHAVDFRVERDYNDAINELDRLLHDPVRPLTPIGATPPLPPAFINRPQYLEPLKQAIQSGDPLVVLTSKQEVAALVGIGGIGKTTVAAALCHDCEIRRTFDQIYWIEVGTDRRGESYAADLMRAAVGGSPDDYKDLASARASFARNLHGGKTLIVLDDVWDVTIAKTFQFGGVDVRILMTTRQKRIVNALGAHAQEIDKLSEAEALEVLTGRSGRDLDEADARAVVQLLDGHALAVGLAGAWLRNRAGKSAGDLLRRLEKNPDFSDLKLDENDKNLNLGRALRLSYDHLSDATRANFRTLGICARSASLGAGLLGAIWSITDEDNIDDAVSGLVDAGLLSPDERGTFYRQHPLLHSYARALLTDAQELDTTFALYTAYITEQAEQFHELPPEQWEGFEVQIPHLIEVGDKFYEKTLQDDIQVSIEEEERWLEFFFISTFYMHQRAIHRPEWFEAGVIISKRHNNRYLQFIFYNNLGVYYSQSGNKIQALQHYSEARKLIDQGAELAHLLNNIGRIY